MLDVRVDFIYGSDPDQFDKDLKKVVRRNTDDRYYTYIVRHQQTARPTGYVEFSAVILAEKWIPDSGI